MASPAAPPLTLSAPPTAPEVTEQQGPTAEFVQNRQSPQGEQAPGPANAAGLIEQKLNQVAAMLKEVAKMLVTNKPDLMPILEKMLQAGSMLMNELQQSMPKNQAGQAGVQRQASPEPTPGQLEGSPPPA